LLSPNQCKFPEEKIIKNQNQEETKLVQIVYAPFYKNFEKKEKN
jgi:hypothetical protein